VPSKRGLGTSNRPAIATKFKDTEVESMKCTGETRTVLRMKKHIDTISRETGIFSILAKKSVVEEIMDAMKTRKELSEKGYSILRKHITKRIDSKLVAESNRISCTAERI
jgi:tartrate dehydratase beta subunit/fumarate hydratase class I family protein